jgi:hypothetical protein
MWIWIRNTAFLLANLQICDLGKGTPRFVICGVLITNVQICRFAEWHTFADLRLRNKSKNLRIFCVPTFAK